jgi:hypothetical protein
MSILPRAFSIFHQKLRTDVREYARAMGGLRTAGTMLEGRLDPALLMERISTLGKGVFDHFDGLPTTRQSGLFRENNLWDA